MLTSLIVLASIIGYVGIGAWHFGYIRGATDDEKNGWGTPLPFLAAVFWPFVMSALVFANIAVPLNKLGFKFQQNRLEKQKKRIAEQEKVRIELQEIENILEKEFIDLEHNELKLTEVKRKKVEKPPYKPFYPDHPYKKGERLGGGRPLPKKL